MKVQLIDCQRAVTSPSRWVCMNIYNKYTFTDDEFLWRTINFWFPLFRFDVTRTSSCLHGVNEWHWQWDSFRDMIVIQTRQSDFLISILQHDYLYLADLSIYITFALIFAGDYIWFYGLRLINLCIMYIIYCESNVPHFK